MMTNVAKIPTVIRDGSKLSAVNFMNLVGERAVGIVHDQRRHNLQVTRIPADNRFNHD